MSRKKSAQIGIFLGTGERIRQVRGRLTQEEFGEIFGVKGSAVSKWEDGRLSDEETLKKIVDFGGVTVEWLLTGESKELPAPDKFITIESPVHASVLSDPTLYGAVDINVMTQIIEAVEQLLGRRKKPLKPVKKALLLSLLYDSFQATGRVPDQVTLKEFLRRVD
jgi:transcriptional regulator with XRE-family HTH domain